MLSHLDESGSAKMVNVGEKVETLRTALAACEIQMKPETLILLKSGRMKKGDAFTVAKVAGIMAAKKTYEAIPLCHPLALEFVDVRFNDESSVCVKVECEALTTGKTGVEMEAMHGAMIAALTVYDMAKSVDPGIIISNVRLVRKTGGKSDYVV